MQSPEELSSPHTALYCELFAQLNPLGKDELDAVSIAAFLRTARGISVLQLSQIWELASEFSGCKNKGALNRLGVFCCFKLVAAAQQGQPISAPALSIPVLPPPQFDVPGGGRPPSRPSAAFPSKSPSVCSELDSQSQSQQQMQMEQPTSWAIGPKEQRKYEAIFDSLGPVGDKLGGHQVKPVLLNSQLPKAQLAKIWDLADLDADGFLDRPEFCLALHLVYRSLQGEQVPDRLHPALVPLAKRPLMRRISVRSVEPMAHPPPLNWSSRASSVTSLNFQPPQPAPLSPTGRLHQIQQSPLNIGQAQVKKSGGGPPLFERNVEEWKVENLAHYEAEFRGLDRDEDGLVGGTDVREVFLRSGLPQSTLARIWAHVDQQRTGKLSLEQYAKCVELIRECRTADALNPPADENGATSAGAPPPPMAGAPLGRRDSQISTGSGIKMQLAENPRVQELNAAIEEMREKRRKAEQDLFQAEADLKVKNSEVKNLEIELLTLEATVKQLKNQRVEARKRLNDLDARMARMEGACEENQKRAEEEETRLAETRQEIQKARDNSEAEEAVLAMLREEYRGRADEWERANLELGTENARFEGFVDELTQLERGMARQEADKTRLETQMAEMKAVLEGLEKGDERAEEELRTKAFSGPIGQPQDVAQWANSLATVTSSAAANANPFPTGDPFAGRDPDPFSSAGDEKTAASDDPFAEKSARDQGSQFANFANFAAFS